MATDDREEDGWMEYRRLVLSELERLNAVMERNTTVTEALRVEVGQLQVKAGIWGGLSGLGAALATALIASFKWGK